MDRLWTVSWTALDSTAALLWHQSNKAGLASGGVTRLIQMFQKGRFAMAQ